MRLASRSAAIVVPCRTAISEAVSPGRTTYEVAKTPEGMVATAVAPRRAAARRDLVGIGFLV